MDLKAGFHQIPIAKRDQRQISIYLSWRILQVAIYALWTSKRAFLLPEAYGQSFTAYPEVRSRSLYRRSTVEV